MRCHRYCNAPHYVLCLRSLRYWLVHDTNIMGDVCCVALRHEPSRYEMTMQQCLISCLLAQTIYTWIWENVSGSIAMQVVAVQESVRHQSVSLLLSMTDHQWQCRRVYLCSLIHWLPNFYCSQQWKWLMTHALLTCNYLHCNRTRNILSYSGVNCLCQ